LVFEKLKADLPDIWPFSHLSFQHSESFCIPQGELGYDQIRMLPVRI